MHNNNNAITNNNYGWLHDFTLFFTIPMVERKNFFKIKRQFGHKPTKRFASPGLPNTG